MGICAASSAVGEEIVGDTERELRDEVRGRGRDERGLRLAHERECAESSPARPTATYTRDAP